MRYKREARKGLKHICWRSEWFWRGVDYFDHDNSVCAVGMNEFGDFGEEIDVHKFLNYLDIPNLIKSFLNVKKILLKFTAVV